MKFIVIKSPVPFFDPVNSRVVIRVNYVLPLKVTSAATIDTAVVTVPTTIPTTYKYY